MKTLRPAMAIIMAILMVCLLCGTAFAADASEDEDIVNVEDIAADEQDAEEATTDDAPAQAEQQGRHLSKSTIKSLAWGFGFVALGLILVVIANKKTGKKKKPNK